VGDRLAAPLHGAVGERTAKRTRAGPDLSKHSPKKARRWGSAQSPPGKTRIVTQLVEGLHLEFTAILSATAQVARRQYAATAPAFDPVQH